MKGKKITSDKKQENIKFRKITKKQRLQEKGITLIALVVTIIILLILAGVTLNIALSDNGLFGKAKKAAEDYKEAQNEEEESIRQIATTMYSEYVGAFVTGYNPTSDVDGCTIGTSTSGTDSAQTIHTEDMKWRIWDFDGNTVRLISEKPTEATLKLQGVAGYNNGVYAINEVCRECYNNSKPGVTVRNLRRSDIEAVSNYDYTKYKHKASGDNAWVEVLDDGSGQDLIYYGERKTYPEDNQAPAMWGKHDNTWTYIYDKKSGTGTGNKSTEVPWEQEYGSETEIGTGSTDGKTEFTQSYYCHNYLNRQEEFKNAKYYDLLFKDKEGIYFGIIYWLAGRYSELMSDFHMFGLHYLNCSASNINVGGWPLVSCSRF